MVCAIYKKGDMSSVSNYRPISLLSCLEKVAERAVFNTFIITYMKTVFSLPYSLVLFQAIPQQTNWPIYMILSLML